MRTLSVTIDDRLYSHLKHAVPARHVSKFVSEALTEKLEQRQAKLYQEYLQASQDQEREQDISAWNDLSIEAWDR